MAYDTNFKSKFGNPMKALEVFYHFYIPPDHLANHSGWWLDNQLGAIVKSGLHSHAKINMCFTMPREWNQVQGIEIRDNDLYNQCTLEYKIKEYLDFRYPFVNILDIRDTSEPNIYEGHTLQFLHKKSKEKNMYALYMTNKGMISNKFAVGNWRDTLNHFLIGKWRECVKLLDNADVVGMKDLFLPISSNHFWADNIYLQTLTDPLDSHVYLRVEKSDMFPFNPAYRYAFEHWITSNNPNIANIHDTNICHYSNYHPIERLSDD
jgi:hypothetical protein